MSNVEIFTLSAIVSECSWGMGQAVDFMYPVAIPQAAYALSSFSAASGYAGGGAASSAGGVEM